MAATKVDAGETTGIETLDDLLTETITIQGKAALSFCLSLAADHPNLGKRIQKFLDAELERPESRLDDEGHVIEQWRCFLAGYEALRT